MTRAKRNPGWRLGGRNAPPWLQAPCIRAVKQRTSDDLELLKEVLKPERLAAAHPFRELWERAADRVALAEARYDLHQLADDIRLVRDVRGGRQLLQTMVDNVDGYEDYRYELRIAACVGRSPGQTLVALGGTAQGPDVQVQTLSGHLCGIACYRGQTWTLSLLVDASKLKAIVERCQTVCAALVVAPEARVLVGISFDKFPISAEMAEAAVSAFTEVWNRPQGDAIAKRDGVVVSREVHENDGVTDPWEVVIAFRLPLPERERFRLTNSVQTKLEKEQRQWAGAYPGVPILCAEESDFTLGFDKESFETRLLEDTQHSIQGILATWQFFADGIVRGSRIRVEQHDWHPRQGSVGLNLGVQTFGENMESYSDGYMVMTMNPHLAEERWKIVGVRDGSVTATCVRPLTIERKMARRPILAPGQEITTAYIEPLVKAVRGEGGTARVVVGSQRRPR